MIKGVGRTEAGDIQTIDDRAQLPCRDPDVNAKKGSDGFSHSRHGIRNRCKPSQKELMTPAIERVKIVLGMDAFCSCQSAGKTA